MEVLKSKMVLYLKKRKRSKAENHVVNKRIKLDNVEQYIDLFQFANVEYIITYKTTYEDQDKFHITVDIHSTRNLWNHKEYSIKQRLKTRNQLCLDENGKILRGFNIDHIRERKTCVMKILRRLIT